MIQALSAYIKNIALFLILTSFISIVVPENKYKEYINLVLGFILIFLMVQPLSRIISAVGNSENAVLTASMSLDNSIWQKEFDGGYYENLQTGQVLEQYKEGLTEQIQTLVDNQSVVTNLYYNSSHLIIDESEEGFGDILSVTVYVEEFKSTASAERPFIYIEKVLIDPIPFLFDNNKPDEENQKWNTIEMDLLKKSISDFYNISEGNIHIRYK